MEYPYNLNFEKRIVIETEKMDWSVSPSPGVERKSLEREFAETGRATSIVRYAPNTFFKEHIHNEGEEIFVISGEFIDEFSRYPAGTWIRSPHLSSHHPFVEQETIIFVKTGHLLIYNIGSSTPTAEKRINQKSAGTNKLIN